MIATAVDGMNKQSLVQFSTENVSIENRQIITDEESPPNVPHYVQLLQGRDGRDGRDGVPAPRGLPGQAGKVGPHGVTGMKGEHGLPGPESGGLTFFKVGPNYLS